MTSFKYKLEAVLSAKKNIENVKQKEYSDSMKNLKNKKQTQEKINKSLMINNNLFRSSIVDTTDPVKVKSIAIYSNVLDMQKKRAIVDIVEAEKIESEKRKELLNAVKDKKTLEILKKRKLKEFIEKSRKKEQIIIDELVSFKASKNKRY